MSDPEAGIPCLWMRGGTSKGAFFLAKDLPAEARARDDVLLRIMGSPDARQIDGIGGADPLTSKVALLGPSTRADADVDYLFLQVFVDQALVSDGDGVATSSTWALSSTKSSTLPMTISWAISWKAFRS